MANVENHSIEPDHTRTIPLLGQRDEQADRKEPALQDDRGAGRVLVQDGKETGLVLQRFLSQGKWISEGPQTARIILVGEAPGGTEASTGRPFQGGAGDILNKMLDRSGIRRADCFVTNLCHVRPPDNKFQWFFRKENQHHYLRGVLKLRSVINEIKPNIVVGFGSHPLKALTGKVGIEKWRGSILDSTLVPGTKVVCTYHPAAILRVYDYKAVAEIDLSRVREESLFPEIVRPVRNHVLHPDPTTRSRLVDEMAAAEWLAVDIECWQTPSGKWRLACVGFSDRPERSLVIHNDGPEALLAIRRLCSCPAKKVYQNGSFDVTVLRDEGIETTNFAWDTMLAHHALYPECASGSDEMAQLGGRKRSAAIQKGLAFLASINTKEPFYKDDGKLWRETNDLRTFWLYNGRDCTVTREVRDVQEGDLEVYGTAGTFQRRMALVEPTMAATRHGIKIDLEVRDSLRENIEAEIRRLQIVLDTLAGEPINVKSPKQVRALLFDKLKLPVKYKRGTSDITSDKAALIELGEKYPSPALHAILKIRERRDLIERYLDATVDADGRMRCSFDITGTRTGRLSSRASIYGSGTNLQNIPSRRAVGEALRRMFIADEGKCLIVRDYSQAEVWIVAHLAKCGKLIDLLTDPTRDIHRETAAGIFGKALDAITDMERYLAKRTVHASNYGIGGKNLAEKVNEDSEVTGITLDARRGDQIINGYFMLYPEIKENFWREVERELKYSLTLTNPFGMKRTFYGRPDYAPQSKFLREAYSFIPQSTVGELGGMAWVNAYRDIELGRPDLDCNILLNVHDALVAQCPHQHVEEVNDLLRQSMNIPVTVNDQTFTIPTDSKVGLNWSKFDKNNPEVNPNGLRDWEKGGHQWLTTLLD